MLNWGFFTSVSVNEIPLFFLQEMSFQEPCLSTNPSVKEENMMITEQEKEENGMNHQPSHNHTPNNITQQLECYYTNHFKQL